MSLRLSGQAPQRAELQYRMRKKRRWFGACLKEAPFPSSVEARLEERDASSQLEVYAALAGSSLTGFQEPMKPKHRAFGVSRNGPMARPCQVPYALCAAE